MKRAIRSSDPGSREARISIPSRRVPARSSFRSVPVADRQDLRAHSCPSSTSPTRRSSLLPSGFTVALSAPVFSAFPAGHHAPTVNFYGRNFDRKALRSTVLYRTAGPPVKLDGPSAARKALRSPADRKDLRPRDSSRKNLRAQIILPAKIYNCLAEFPLTISI